MIYVVIVSPLFQTEQIVGSDINYTSITLVGRMIDRQYFRMISSSMNETKNTPGCLLKQPGPSEFSTGQLHKYLWLINGFNRGHRHVIKETDSLSVWGFNINMAKLSPESRVRR